MKKVVFCIGSRANYASIKSAIQASVHDSRLDVRILTYASAVSARYGDLERQIISDGFRIDTKIESLLEGSSPRSMAESTGLGTLKIASALESHAPDYVVTVGDRYETMSVAIASSYMNIKLVHTMGGELSGSIDELIRHAISKLAHIHFPATEEARRVLLQLGEDDSRIFRVGCPRIDLALNALDLDDKVLENVCNDYGVGDTLDFQKPFAMLVQHPVTTEFDEIQRQIHPTLKAISNTDIPLLVLWPNSDAGSDFISTSLRRWGQKIHQRPVHFVRNLPPEIYLKLLSKTSCLIGNSSSGIREGAFLGTPVVNIGSRQSNREHGSNVDFVENIESKIEIAINKQIKHGPYNPSNLYGDGTAGRKIAKILAELEDVEIQKKFLRLKRVD